MSVLSKRCDWRRWVVVTLLALSFVFAPHHGHTGTPAQAEPTAEVFAGDSRMPAEAPPLGETLLEQSDHCTSCSTPMLSASTGQPIWLLAATKVYLKLADACSDPSAWPGVFRRVPAADYDIGLIEAACIGVAAIALQSIQRLSIT